MALEDDLSRELQNSFPPSDGLIKRVTSPADVQRPRHTQPPPTVTRETAQQLARPLVRLADALDRIDQLAQAIEKAGNDAEKLLATVRGKL
jgi:ABC-type transporter Mla subunit MlaD